MPIEFREILAERNLERNISYFPERVGSQGVYSLRHYPITPMRMERLIVKTPDPSLYIHDVRVGTLSLFKEGVFEVGCDQASIAVGGYPLEQIVAQPEQLISLLVGRRPGLRIPFEFRAEIRVENEEVCPAMPVVLKLASGREKPYSIQATSYPPYILTPTQVFKHRRLERYEEVPDVLRYFVSITT